MLKFTNGAQTGPALELSSLRLTSLVKIERNIKNSSTAKGAKITLGNSFFLISSITVKASEVRGRVLSENIIFQY